MVKYSLIRASDGAGDSGPMSLLFRPLLNEWGAPTGEFEELHNARPEKGGVMRVGTYFPRSFTSDWWQTTIITEILDDQPNRVRFKTLNSIYEWEIIE